MEPILFVRHWRFSDISGCDRRRLVVGATPINLGTCADRSNAKLCAFLCAVPTTQTPLFADHPYRPGNRSPRPGAARQDHRLRAHYSIDNGLDQVPALAAKVGLKVIQGSGSAAIA